MSHKIPTAQLQKLLDPGHEIEDVSQNLTLAKIIEDAAQANISNNLGERSPLPPHALGPP